MEVPQGSLGDFLVHAIVGGRGGDNGGLHQLHLGEVLRVVDGSVVQQLVDELCGRLVSVGVGQRKAEVVQEHDHLEPLWRPKHPTPVLGQLGHHRVEDGRLLDARRQVEGEGLLGLRVEPLGDSVVEVVSLAGPPGTEEQQGLVPPVDGHLSHSPGHLIARSIMCW